MCWSGSAKDTVKGAAGDVKDAAGSAADKVKSVGSDAGECVLLPRITGNFMPNYFATVLEYGMCRAYLPMATVPVSKCDVLAAACIAIHHVWWLHPACIYSHGLLPRALCFIC